MLLKLVEKQGRLEWFLKNKYIEFNDLIMMIELKWPLN